MVAAPVELHVLMGVSRGWVGGGWEFAWPMLAHPLARRRLVI